MLVAMFSRVLAMSREQGWIFGGHDEHSESPIAAANLIYASFERKIVVFPLWRIC